MENKKLLPVKLDLVFKLIFGDQRNTDILASFLKSVLDIPEEEYERVTIVDPPRQGGTFGRQVRDT